MRYPAAKFRPSYEAYPSDMGRPEKRVQEPLKPINENAWGQSLPLNPPFVENQEFPLIEVPKLEGRIARVQNLTLGMDVPNDAVGATTNYIFRWIVRFGVGGGTRRVEIDANGFQQLSLSAERLTISAVIRKYKPDTVLFNPPTSQVNATVFAADGTTATDAPTFSNAYEIGTGATLSVAAPAGATGWRILGEEPAQANSPFDVDVSYAVHLNGLAIDSYLGSYIDGYRIAHIPLGPGTSLQIVNGDLANAKKLGIEWSIDL